MTRSSLVHSLASAVAKAGGRAYYVGGYVRDRLLGQDTKDLDIEIHGLSPQTLEDILDTLGERTLMGASFGVYGLKHWDIDIAMPRKETALGKGHKDFRTEVDPFLGCKKASERRDFTINAMMEDVLSGEVLDYFGGQKDLEQGILRYVSAQHFGEDALRVLRGAQFSARFGFTLAAETVELCKTMDLSFLPKERVMGELAKALCKAEKPSLFFEALRESEQLDIWFPELKALLATPQSPRFHPEGNVWKHSMKVLDRAAVYRHQAKNPLVLMLSALCHDFGKSITTEYITGDYHAYEHESKGIPLIEDFLYRLTGERSLIALVSNLCLQHMRPNKMAQQNSSQKSWNHLFDQTLCPEDLLLLSKADYLGCGGTKSEDYVPLEARIREALSAFYADMAKPYVMGRDLKNAGIPAGKGYGELLAFAHKLRLAGVEKEVALKQVLAMAKKQRK